jgi:Lon protease-like protein
MASPHSLIVRLPSGTEYWYAEELPEPGETVSHFGTAYHVCSVEQTGDDRFVITLAEEEVSTDTVASSPLT